MNEYELKKLIDNNSYLDSKIDYYISKGLITSEITKSEISGHIEKSRHNLEFLSEIRTLFNDWKLIVCYYAAYHAALALILSKGNFSKSHDATLCLLIKYFYNSGLEKEDIELLNALDSQDLFFYVESKQKREDAQYSTKILFDIKDVNMIKLKTILFVNKSEKLVFK